jgi:two-component system OmpR family response regulator
MGSDLPNEQRSSTVHDQEIYSLTPLGERQLRGAMTTAFPAEVELLVRVDGILTVGQIKAGMTPVAPSNFDATFSRLITMGLLHVRRDDPFATQFITMPSTKALTWAAAEADAASASLQKTGYFVCIAHQRPLRALAQNKTPSALIVEDEPHLARFLQHYLRFEGFHVRIAGTRAEVVAELRKFPVPDLVLLDVMLPDVDGFDILLRMRQHLAFKDVPVIMLTGKATREAVIKGLAGGANGYVTKPFEADTLLEAVRSVTGLPGDAPPVPPSHRLWAKHHPASAWQSP